MLFIRSINPSYRAHPTPPPLGAQPLARLMTSRAKNACSRVYGGGALRTFLHPASLLILNFYPRTRQETPCGGLVDAGRTRTLPRSQHPPALCCPPLLLFSQLSSYPPTYLPPSHRETEPSRATNPFRTDRSNAGAQTTAASKRDACRPAIVSLKNCTPTPDEMIATGTARSFFFSGGGRRGRGRKVGGWRKRLKGGWRCGWKTRGLLDGRGDQ